MRQSEYRDIENRKYPSRVKTPRPTVLGAPRRIAVLPQCLDPRYISPPASPVGIVRYAARRRSRERWSS